MGYAKADSEQSQSIAARWLKHVGKLHEERGRFVYLM